MAVPGPVLRIGRALPGVAGTYMVMNKQGRPWARLGWGTGFASNHSLDPGLGDLSAPARGERRQALGPHNIRITCWRRAALYGCPDCALNKFRDTLPIIRREPHGTVVLAGRQQCATNGVLTWESGDLASSSPGSGLAVTPLRAIFVSLPLWELVPDCVQMHWLLRALLGPSSKFLDVMRVLFALPHGQASNLGNWNLFLGSCKAG